MGLFNSLLGPTGASFNQAYNQGGLLNALGILTDPQQPAAAPAPAPTPHQLTTPQAADASSGSPIARWFGDMPGVGQAYTSFNQAYNQGGLVDAIGSMINPQQLPPNTGADMGANAGAAAAAGAFTPASPAAAAATGAVQGAAAPTSDLDNIKKFLGGMGNVTLPAQPMDLSPSPMPSMPFGFSPKPLDMRGIQALVQRPKLGL